MTTRRRPPWPRGGWPGSSRRAGCGSARPAILMTEQKLHEYGHPRAGYTPEHRHDVPAQLAPRGGDRGRIEARLPAPLHRRSCRRRAAAPRGPRRRGSGPRPAPPRPARSSRRGPGASDVSQVIRCGPPMTASAPVRRATPRGPGRGGTGGSARPPAPQRSAAPAALEELEVPGVGLDVFVDRVDLERAGPTRGGVRLARYAHRAVGHEAARNRSTQPSASYLLGLTMTTRRPSEEAIRPPVRMQTRRLYARGRLRLPLRLRFLGRGGEPPASRRSSRRRRSGAGSQRA